MIRNTVNEVQFMLREKFLGKLTLRSGLPTLGPPAEATGGEREFYRLLLTRAISPGVAQGVKQVVDVGCRNWSYARTLSEIFPAARLIGLDVDGVRRYWNLYRRIDVARAYAQELCLEGHPAEAHAQNFLDFDSLKETAPVLYSFFFPFVSENPCLKWGLPARFANFAALLKHSCSLVSKARIAHATWISAHQGEWEAEEARECYVKAGIKFEEKLLGAEEVKGLWPSLYETRIMVGRLPPSS